MDGDAAHRNYKLSRAALKAGKRALLPTWDEFKRHILARVEEYNRTPHRGLPMFTAPDGRRRHYSPDEYWQSFVERGFQPVIVPEALREELFMPAERRQVRNGWIQFYKGHYFAAELADWHEQYVEVRYDIWDASKIYVWSPEGRKICTARLDGNTIPYFPQTRIEAARERREKAQVTRLDNKLQRIVPGAEIILPEKDRPLELADSTRPGIVLEFPARETEPETREITRPVLFRAQYERYRWCMAHPDLCTGADHEWLPRYAASEEYGDMAELYAVEGIAWRN